MGLRKRVSPASMLIVMVAAGFLLAGDEGRQLYDLRYADQRKKVDATSGKADDVALAAQHLADVEKYASSPALVKVLLEQAYELGMRDATGYATGAQAVELLIAKFPDDKAAYVDKAIRVYHLQVRRNQDRKAAGEKLLALLLEQAEAAAGKSDFNEAVKLTATASKAAADIKYPRKPEIDALRKYYQSRRDLKIKPSSAVLRRKVIGMCVVELDDPAEGAELLTGDMPEQLRTYVPLAAKDPAEVTDVACLELGNWYVELAKRASAGGKVICLDRAIVYLRRFLGLHKTEDDSRIQGVLLLDKAKAQRKKLGVTAKPTVKPGEWIDLLKSVDLSKHVLRGKWVRQGEAVTSLQPVVAGSGQAPRVVIPVRPKSSYELRVRFARTSETKLVGFVLPTGTSQVRLTLGAGAKNSGLDNIAKESSLSTRNPTRCTVNLANEKDHDVLARVLMKGRGVQIDVTFDGEKLIHWEGSPSLLSVPSASEIPARGYFGLIARSPTIFKEVKLRMLSGEAKLIDQQAEKPGEWIDLLKLVDVKRHRVAGDWYRQGKFIGRKAKSATVGGQRPRIILPFEIQGSYEMRAAFIRREDNHQIGFVLPLRQRGVTILLCVGGTPKAHKLTRIEGGDISYKPGGIKNGRLYRISATVLIEGENASIAVRLDDTEVFQWSGPLSSCSLSPEYALPQPSCLALVASSPTVFHAVECRMLPAKAKVEK